MPPFEFASVKELRAKLGSSEIRKEFNKFFARRHETFAPLIGMSVSANTVRAFPHRRFGVEIGPLEVYRHLAGLLCEREFENWRKIKNRGEMHSFIAEQAEDFRRRWIKETKTKSFDGYDIGFGRAAKLLNLLFKHLTMSTILRDDERTRLIGLLEVPLDSYTLVGMRGLYPNGKIGRNASMGFVKCKEQYIELQDVISKLCAPEFYPVQYEIAAWNASHSRDAKLGR